MPPTRNCVPFRMPGRGNGTRSSRTPDAKFEPYTCATVPGASAPPTTAFRLFRAPPVTNGGADGSRATPPNNLAFAGSKRTSRGVYGNRGLRGGYTGLPDRGVGPWRP